MCTTHIICYKCNRLFWSCEYVLRKKLHPCVWIHFQTLRTLFRNWRSALWQVLHIDVKLNCRGRSKKSNFRKDAGLVCDKKYSAISAEITKKIKDTPCIWNLGRTYIYFFIFFNAICVYIYIYTQCNGTIIGELCGKLDSIMNVVF